MIDLKNINTFYGEDRILKDISLSINSKEILAVIGPSGCGKSTLLYTLNGLINDRGGHYEGDIFYKNGEDILNFSSLNEEEIRTLIGTVFQTPTPFPFSVEKNLKFPLAYRKTPKKEMDRIVDELLKKVGLDDEVNKKKDALALSGGQQQRLCIARAMTVKPKYLLLDEPCSQLDINNTQRIESLLLNLKEDTGIVIVTHNLAQAKRIADRVLFLMNGEMIEIGDKEHIFNSPQHELTKDYISGIVG